MRYSASDIQGLEEKQKATDDQLAVFHLLELAQQGRPHEVAAQFMASWIMSSELDQDEVTGFFMDLNRIRNRMAYLAIHPEEIWDGLLPGGPNGEPRFGVVYADDWTEMSKDAHMFRRCFDIFALDITDEERMERMGEILKTEGYVKEKQAHEPNGIDAYTYVYRIIPHPSIHHDEPKGVYLYQDTISTTSPLNLAATVIGEMDRMDRIGRWPAEELAAWITNPESGSRWLMTWDQARAIAALETCQDAMNSVSFDGQPDWDEMFQGIHDQMAISGQELLPDKMINE